MYYKVGNENSYNSLQQASDSAVLELIGSFVKEKRLERNITQSQLSKNAGVSRSTLSLLEKGQPVALKTLVQVLRVLNELDVLANFIIKPEVSPLVVFDEQSKLRKRARGTTNDDIPYESEW